VFQRWLKVEPVFEYNPVMSDQAILRFRGEDEALRVEQHLHSYRLFDRPAFHTSVKGADLMVQCYHGGVVPPETVLTRDTSSRTVPFFEIFYSMDVIKSGYHHPDGMLWVRYPNRTHAIHENKVSVRSIAPAVLELFNLPQPEYMTSQSFLRHGSTKLVASGST
jgi:hypothetical protein